MRVTVPEHVVYRDFASETVVLNLDNGQYYGLNPTAARMLSAMQETGSTDAALRRLGQELAVEDERLRADLRGLCSELERRGIIVLDGDDG